MSEQSLCCCFTGHRFLPFEDMGRIENLIERMVDKLTAAGYRDFMSGGALGFDMLAAEVVLRKKKSNPDIRLVLALPCKNQHEKWRTSERKRYENLLALADEKVYLSEEYVTGCMHLRNRYMVDRCDLCLAFLTKRSGGTKFTVDYAKESGKEVLNLAHIL